MPEITTPNTLQHTKDKTITTNTTGPLMNQGIVVPEPPKSSLAITAVTLLILGFAVITGGLVIPPATIYMTILGISLILSANVVALLSLRELS